jgi:hypothetical protein
MGGGKAKPSPPLPFEQKQTQTNTYTPLSIAGTQEAKDFSSVPLDFGSEVSVDPGVQRRTDLRRQQVGNRYDSAINFGVPAFIREMNKARELREIDTQGNAEMQQAEYANQQANNERQRALTIAELGRKERLLPQIGQASTSGTSSGFNTQLIQPTPGPFSGFFGGLGAGIGGALQFPKI